MCSLQQELLAMQKTMQSVVEKMCSFPHLKISGDARRELGAKPQKCCLAPTVKRNGHESGDEL